MRLQGYVVKVISEHLVLVETDKQRRWRIVADQEISRLGGHRCNLQNAGVTFEFDGTRVTNFSVNLPDHNGEEPEISTISFTKHLSSPACLNRGWYGFLKRNNCGCHLAFNIDEILTWGDVCVGAEAQHFVGIDAAGRAAATQIELFVPAVK